ncbi:hypothetical protein GGR50DRAFT_701165 [Xylaria sp. CBS 124048]|nr:hypothetical protein GGR50DRAFT_701165 [Xylaria sp. CBS 124048]
MSTPYWGQLPPPTKARRLPEDSYDQSDGSLSQPRHNPTRAFAQTNAAVVPTEPAYSPLTSPTTAHAFGRAPIPPPRSSSQTQGDHLDRRPTQRVQNRDEKAYESANVSLPPVPSPLPGALSVNHKQFYGNDSSSYLYGAAGQPGATRASHRPEYWRSTNMTPEPFYEDGESLEERKLTQPTTNQARQDLDDSMVSPEFLERELVRSGSIRRPLPNYQPDRLSAAPQSHREFLAPEPEQRAWAADRSPLQKLELTLDGITKEEKRARVEAAEKRARERAAKLGESVRPLPDPPSGQYMRSKDKSQVADEERSRRAVIAQPAQAVPSAATTHGIPSQYSPAVWQQHGFSEQPSRSQVPAPRRPSISAANSNAPQRNLSFRERTATQECGASQEFDDGPSHIRQTSKPSAGFALVRTGSNKLKKNPPSYLLYNAQREADEGAMERSATYDRFNSADAGTLEGTRPPYHDVNYATMRPTGKTSKNFSLPMEDTPRPPARGKTFEGERVEEERPSRIRGLAAAMGFGRSNTIARSNSMKIDRRASLPNTNHNTAVPSGQYTQNNSQDASSNRRDTIPAPIKSIRVDSMSQSVVSNKGLSQGTQASDRGTKSVKFQDWQHETGTDDGTMPEAVHHRHRLREHHHHDGSKSGQTTYRAPKYLDEWKRGQVGILPMSMLDLGEGHSQSQVKSSTWWDEHSKRRPSLSAQRPKGSFGSGNDTSQARTAFSPRLYLKCGPLLRYCGIDYEPIETLTEDDPVLEKEIWRGSVMIVTQDSESSYDIAPTLRLFVQPIELLPPPPAELSGGQPLPPEYVDPIMGIPKIGRYGETLYVRPVDHLEEAKDLSMTEPDDGLFEITRTLSDYDTNAFDPPSSFTSRKERIEVDGEKLGKYKDVRGIRLHAERGHTFWRFNIAVELSDEQQRIAYRINQGPATGFWVPARGESMNVMFHSCNGFSRSVNPNDFSGPDPMWRDVLNNHQTRPFHVMIGGGDQVYNDTVANKGKLFREWLEIKNPVHKSTAPFTAAMQDELETFYFERYMVWFSQGLFGLANSQIPMVNMYDDHDIIDGFGSYPHHFMKSPVFSGLGNVAFKYYLLFQHQSVPDETEKSEPSWCIGDKPGPYIHQPNRSLFVSLGKRVALLAVDTRTERTRDEVVNSKTWGKLIDRCYESIEKGRTHHLLVLLGVPIAYPRLVWLENILTSKLMDPVKAMGKAGMLGNFVNNFDGGVEILDDLDDHWTAKNHKKERKIVIEDLQDLAVDKCLRVTILSGDVHLAAVGQFYSNPKLHIPKHKDFRYMPNIISSAIANTPPTDLMADVLNKRNKIHHFDKDTEESMVPLFAHGVDAKPRNNKHMLPHRNWCSIREYVPGNTPPSTPPPQEENFEHTPEITPPGSRGGLFRRFSLSKDRDPLPQPDIPKEPTNRSRPPVSGGLMRAFSRRGSGSDELGRPSSSGLMRTLSLGARPRNPFRRDNKKRNPDDGGINGSWGDDSDEHVFTAPTPQGSHSGSYAPGLRGGGDTEYEIGDEAQFTAHPPRRAFTQPAPGGKNLQHGYIQGGSDGGPSLPNLNRPFHRTPTDLDIKKVQKHGLEHFAVNVEGGLDICLNVEVNPKDPAGITVPYRLFVPRLWYDYDNEDTSQDSEAEVGPEVEAESDMSVE